MKSAEPKHHYRELVDEGPSSARFLVEVDDVDRLCAEYEGRGAKIIQAPTNFAWGRREMVVEDPDGHRFRFASAPTGEPDGTRPAR